MKSEPPTSTLRLALRASNGFTLDLLQIHRGDRDFTDALILAALVQSNSAPIAGDVDLQRRYAVFDTPVPEHIRRAISINALSSSLGVPFETVRRRIKRLVADGLCDATPQGVRFADELLMSEAHRRALEANYETVRGLYQRLGRNNCLRLMSLPPYAEAFGPGGPSPFRIVWRMSADYFLRVTELLLPRFASLTQALVILEVVHANTQGMPDALRGEDGLEPDAFPPDSYRRPVRTSELAGLLGLPHETARRNLLDLVEDGRVERVRDGFIVPAAVLARANVVAGWTANFRNLSRMFADLAQTGVLARWDAEREAAENAA
jgi:DNA-binding Lrp family transcriptional regulator